MAITCKICGKGCQWCGRKCACGWGANMISAANSMYDLGMSVDMIKANISNIYNWKRKYTSVEIYDHLVNGVELPEKKGYINEGAEVVQNYVNTVQNFKPTPNPTPHCVYLREGEKWQVTVWSRCIYCNCVKQYAPKVCPSYWLKTDEEDKDNKDVLNSNKEE